MRKLCQPLYFHHKPSSLRSMNRVLLKLYISRNLYFTNFILLKQVCFFHAIYLKRSVFHNYFLRLRPQRILVEDVFVWFKFSNHFLRYLLNTNCHINPHLIWYLLFPFKSSVLKDFSISPFKFHQRIQGVFHSPPPPSYSKFDQSLTLHHFYNPLFPPKEKVANL